MDKLKDRYAAPQASIVEAYVTGMLCVSFVNDGTQEYNPSEWDPFA